MMSVNRDQKRVHFSLRVANWLLLFALLLLGVCHADVPTPAQECRLRKAAICEVNSVRFVVDGPCPAGARTIRPPGEERCADAAPSDAPRTGQARLLATAATPALVSGPPPTAPASSDLAWLGRVERWLLPLVLAVVGVLIGGLGVWALIWRRRTRLSVPARSAIGRSLLHFLVAAACAVPLAYQAAALAFWRVFSSADNHDTALPWLLAAPLAVGVFLLVAVLTFALVALILSWLFKGARQDPPND